MEYWIVGENRNCSDCKAGWGFIGVFNNKQKAIDACIKDNYFIGPALLNEAFPDEPFPWPDSYYPRLETETRYPCKLKDK